MIDDRIQYEQMEKLHGDHKEVFGVKYSVGDIVGCFLDADDHNISKNLSARSCSSIVIRF